MSNHFVKSIGRLASWLFGDATLPSDLVGDTFFFFFLYKCVTVSLLLYCKGSPCSSLILPRMKASSESLLMASSASRVD